MKTVRWARPAANHRRILRLPDLVQLGIADNFKEDLIWSGQNNFEIVMNNRASDSLVDKLPGEFVVFDIDGSDDDESPVLDQLTTLTPPQSELDSSSDDQVTGDSQQSLDLSVSDETASKQSSTRKGNPVK